MTDTTKSIIEQLLAVPKGRVVCYRDIAVRAGIVNGARQVVRVLHSMTEKYHLPWYRVVRSDGFIALQGDGKDLQIELLRKEGVIVSDEGYIDMKKFS